MVRTEKSVRLAIARSTTCGYHQGALSFVMRPGDSFSYRGLRSSRAGLGADQHGSQLRDSQGERAGCRRLPSPDRWQGYQGLLCRGTGGRYQSRSGAWHAQYLQAQEVLRQLYDYWKIVQTLRDIVVVEYATMGRDFPRPLTYEQVRPKLDERLAGLTGNPSEAYHRRVARSGSRTNRTKLF